MRALRWLALLLVVGLAAAAGVAWWAWERLHRPYQGYVGTERIVEVPAGSDGGSILRRLEAEGVIENADLARAYLIYGLDGASLKAGEYRFEGPRTAPEVLDKLIRGDVLTHRLTVIEGLTVDETARHIADAGFGDYDSLLAEMSEPQRIVDLDPEADDLEGYLFPDTYAFARGTSEKEIVDAITGTFRHRLAEELEPAGFDSESSSLRDLVTLASIVEKEAMLDEERPTIAGVYSNRLERGIALYADPTVIFALKRLDRWDGNLRRPDLKLDSPYNTYLYSGLPPGPIASPGLSSLLAALHPADVPYIYFVSRNDGSHVFATTLGEHNRNVERWQRRYWRERWAREK